MTTDIEESCDCCGREGDSERYFMEFFLDGDSVVTGYSLCSTCLPKMTVDKDATDKFFANVMRNTPELMAYANTGGNA